jgi:hypothetical protein
VRRRRRARNVTAAAGATTAIFGGGTFAAWSPHLLGSLGPVTEFLLDATSVGFGGLTVLAGAGAIGAGLRYRKLKRMPLPDSAPEPVKLPPPDSCAREPMRRLNGAERSLHDALRELGATHADMVTEVRGTAANAAAGMRRVAGRIHVVESDLPHMPESERPGLESEVRRMEAELDEGVTAYGQLVAAAARAVAASGDHERDRGMQDATDRLAGLASAWEELTSSHRQVFPRWHRDHR